MFLMVEQLSSVFFLKNINLDLFMQILKSTEQLGKIIRKARKKQKLTQEQLAATCGVGVRFIRELEQGKISSQFIGILVLKKHIS